MVRDLEERFIAGDQEAALAIEMFCYRVATTLASYIVPLGGWVMCQAVSNIVTPGLLVWMLLFSQEELVRSLLSRELKLSVNIRKKAKWKVIFLF